jgi:predicted acyl esterase
LKWIGEQAWSNGKVGSMGTSYGGATQHALALANAPNLAAMVPVDAMSNYGRYGIRHNGAFELRWFNWVFTLGNATGTRAARRVFRKAQRGDGRAAAAVNVEAAPRSKSWACISASTSSCSHYDRHDATQVRARLRGVADRGNASTATTMRSGRTWVRASWITSPNKGRARLSRHWLVRFVGHAGR